MNWRIFAIVVAAAVAGPPLAAEVGRLIGCQLSETPPACEGLAALPRIESPPPPGGGPRVLLHFWRPNCPVSVRTQAHVRRLQAEGCQIRSINTLRHGKLSAGYQINATPTFITLEDGVVVHRVAAGLSRAQIAGLLVDP